MQSAIERDKGTGKCEQAEHSGIYSVTMVTFSLSKLTLEGVNMNCFDVNGIV